MNETFETGSFDFFKEKGFYRLFEKIARPIIIADRLRTPENMGSVLRLAGNIGAAKVIFIKDEEYPEARNWKIKKTASGADKKVQWEFCKSHELFDHIPEDYVLTALETTPSATNLFETELPQKMAVVIGNEVHGIEEALLKKAEKTVFIPVPGVISSLNVTHALSVILFEWLRTNLSGLH